MYITTDTNVTPNKNPPDAFPAGRGTWPAPPAPSQLGSGTPPSVRRPGSSIRLPALAQCPAISAIYEPEICVSELIINM